MTLNEAREAYYADQTNSTAAHYIMEALADFNEGDLEKPIPFIRASAEVAFWLKWGKLRKFPYPDCR